MEHDHTHGANKKVLLISFLIITAYLIVEAIGGFLTNSLALLADAGHMLSDSISLAIALIAFKLGEKAASKSKTFGYKRFEILAAVLNGITLIVIALFIFSEAIQRFANPPEVATTGMLIVSSVGLAVNILVAWIMMRDGDVEGNLNMKGAYLHVISDMLGSIGAIVAALLIMVFGWGWADPLASVIVSCHAVVDDQMTIADSEQLLRSIEHDLLHQNIHHVTIQLETFAHQHDDSILCQMKPEESGGHHHHH